MSPSPHRNPSPDPGGAAVRRKGPSPTWTCSRARAGHRQGVHRFVPNRIEDLRAAAAIARGRKVAAGVQALVVPGSEQV